MSGDVGRLDDCLSVRDRALFVEDCAAEELAQRFGTPLYVVSEDQLRRNARRFADAFAARWPGGFLLLPSIKANSALALRRILTDAGTGCDVFGPNELEAALRTGTDPERISLNGAMKDEALLERAIDAGVRITLDSRVELERTAAVAARLGSRAHVRFRCRPDLVGMDEPSEMSPDGLSIRDAIQRYKAGIPSEDLFAITEAEIRDPNLDVAGLMLHLGRHSADPALWSAGIDALATILERLRSAWGGWAPRELDLGGGFPAPRDPFGRRLPQRLDAPARSPAIDVYADAICSRLVARLDRLGIAAAAIQLEIEPGRGLYADAGIHLATVGNVKRQSEPMPLTWVETDSSDAYLADVNLEFNRWTCVAVADAVAPATVIADVTGRTCALDVIVADAELPPVEVGDVLAFLDTGAYQDASASNFNALPRPGTALVSGELGGADPPPRDDRRRLRPRPDPGAPPHRLCRRGCALARDRARPCLGDERRSRPFARLLPRPARSDAARARRRAGSGRAQDHRGHRRHRALGGPRAPPRTGSRADRIYASAWHTEHAQSERSGGDPHLTSGDRHRRDLRSPSRCRGQRPQRAGDDRRSRCLGGRQVLLRERSRRGDGGADPEMSEPRTVWVTGAASGMGASHARRFASIGDRVGCWDVQAEALDQIVEEIRGAGGEAEGVVADISDWDAVDTGAARLREALGPADVVVANAGILLSGEHIADLDPDAWRRVIDVNLTGAFLTAKAAIPQLRETGGGSMILVSSICGLTASSGYGAYNASKHGVIGLMRTLAHELRFDGVNVNAVCPGWIRTPMFDVSLDEAAEPGEDLDAFARMTMIERLIEPGEVTDAVVWLASPAARTITAVALPVDGGLLESRAWPETDEDLEQRKRGG